MRSFFMARHYRARPLDSELDYTAATGAPTRKSSIISASHSATGTIAPTTRSPPGILNRPDQVGTAWWRP